MSPLPETPPEKLAIEKWLRELSFSQLGLEDCNGKEYKEEVKLCSIGWDERVKGKIKKLNPYYKEKDSIPYYNTILFLLG